MSGDLTSKERGIDLESYKCPFCDRLRDETGSIWHVPNCEGLENAGINKLQHHMLLSRRVRQQLLAIAKRYAAECRLCGGHGVRRRLDVDGVPLDDVACEQCADVRLVIARAEGR